MTNGGRWEMRITRLEVQRDSGLSRTYGEYAVFLNGVPEGLDGNVCECAGRGNNGPTGVAAHSRIEAKSYGLSTHYGRYRSHGYSADPHHVAEVPMPGVMLRGTGSRTSILIHPGHPPHLYLSSIGCLNLTGPLAPNQSMDFWESRDRVVAVLDSLTRFDPGAFAGRADKPISGASVVISGEPD